MIGKKIGRYEIVKELGRGGMATVFRASDPRFGREVAVKVMPKQFMDDELLRKRFEREARTIAALEHPAIVPVYDFGEEAGQPYLVMRIMEGGSLSDRLKQHGALNGTETVRILDRICGALDAAHEKGIIHRDMKPGNILFDRYGSAYLSDFGIVRLTEGEATLTGQQMIGTPGYMSPEQIQGENIDLRTDVYATGVMVYQMLTGQLPFSATSAAMIMVKHISEPVPDVNLLNPNIPSGVGKAIQKAMDKDMGQRHATAGALAHDIAVAYGLSLMSGVRGPSTPIKPSSTPAAPTTPEFKTNPTPRPAQSPSVAPISSIAAETQVDEPHGSTVIVDRPVPSTPKKKRRPTALLLVGGLVGLILFILAGMFVLGIMFAGNDDDPPNTRIVEEEDSNVNVVATAPPDDDQIDESNIDGAFGERIVPSVATAITADDRPDLYEQLLEARMAYDEGDGPRVLEIAGSILAAEPRFADAHQIKAETYRYLLGDIDNSIQSHLEAVRLDSYSPYYLTSYADTLIHIGEFEEARYYIGICIDNERHSDCFVARSILNQHLGDGEQAAADLELALQLEPENPWAHFQAGEIHFGNKEWVRAANSYRRTFAINKTDIYAYERAVDALIFAGSTQEALAVATLCANNNEEHPRCLFLQGTVHQYDGDDESAAIAFRAAAAAEPDNGYFLMQLGYALLAIGEDEEARDVFVNAHAADPTISSPLVELAFFAYEDDELEIALEYAEQAVDIGDGNAWSYWVLAITLSDLDRNGEAADAYQGYLDHVTAGDCPECEEEAREFLDSQ